MNELEDEGRNAIDGPTSPTKDISPDDFILGMSFTHLILTGIEIKEVG